MIEEAVEIPVELGPPGAIVWQATQAPLPVKAARITPAAWPPPP